MLTFISKIQAGDSLAAEQAQTAMDKIMSGEATPEQIGDFLIALKNKGESAEEVAGFVNSMRSHSLKLELDDKNAVDGCGTGGDGSNSFNISTAAAIVAASAGVTIAKHGNRSVSSKCGSADILEFMGGNIDPGVDATQEAINKIGFGFIFAPRFHPAMKHAGPVRKKLGVRTVFNILGPMTNPATVTRQVIGVYDKTLMPLMAEVLKLTGSQHVLVAHSDDGMDEFSVSADTNFVELKDGNLETKKISATDVGLAIHSSELLAGGEPIDNVKIFHAVLDGQQSACLDAVLFNAGAMIYVSGKVDSIKIGVELAREAVESGKAKNKLAQWIEFSNNS